MIKSAKPARKRATKPRAGRIGRPPGQPGDETRARILVAARETFGKLGFEGATNHHIATAAGITAAALYRYFDSKLELYAAVYRDAIAVDLVPHVRVATASQQGTRSKLIALLRSLGNADRSQVAAARFLAAIPVEMQSNPAVARRIIAEPGEFFAIVTEIVEAGVRTGEVARDKAPRLVAVVMALLMGVSAYINIVGSDQLRNVSEGFIELLDNELFKSKK